MPVHASLAQGRTLGIRVEGIQRLAADHEEPVALGPAEGEVGDPLWDHDSGNHRFVRHEEG